MKEICKVEGCNKQSQHRGYCDMHYTRVVRYGEPGPAHPLRNRKSKYCNVDGCNEIHSAKGLCEAHYYRLKRESTLGGSVTSKTRSRGKGTINYGYRVLHMPEHPNAAPSSGKVPEHVVVMSKIIGRPLHSKETVHHKNGIRNDNRPKNLELWASRHPPGQRVSDLQEFATELAFEYGLVGELPY